MRTDLISRLAAISAGGALGSVARWGLTELWPPEVGSISWATVAANLSGGFLLGAVMVLVLDVWPHTRLLRPFLGVGVLGGYTTFSTFALDTGGLLVAGEPLEVAGYLAVTLVVGLLAVWFGGTLTRGYVVHRRTRGRAPTDHRAPTSARPRGRTRR